MARLRLGRFAWELYYTRTRAVLPREEVRRKAALFCGHLGYVTGLFEYVMTDMLWLRGFALSGCVLIVGYQMAQPRILWISAGWNTIYSMVNIYHIYLLRRTPPALSEDASALFEALGGEGRMARWRFQELLEAGSWRSFKAGERLAEEGLTGNAGEVCLLATGACDVSLGGLVVGALGPGSVVGAERAAAVGADRETIPPSSTTVAARQGGARCLCVSLEWLEGAPELREALRGAVADALGGEVTAMSKATTALHYAAVLEWACTTGHDPAISAAVEAYRKRRRVSDEEHFRIARAVPQCVARGLQRWVPASPPGQSPQAQYVHAGISAAGSG